MRLSLIPPSLALWASVVSASGFANTCENISFSGTTLQADCIEKGSGKYSTPTIDLNRCLSNTNGNLACKANGGYTGSCRNCSLQGSTAFGCQCRNINGNYVGTTVDLNNCISNVNGQLTC